MLPLPLFQNLKNLNMKKKGLNFMNSIQVMNPNSSVFDLTHDHKLSCNMGQLVPVMVMDCVPGDKVDINTQALIRYAPLTSPMMHRSNVTFHTWAVPYRILWPNWEDYITETKSGGVLPAFPFITIQADGTNYTQLADNMGIPLPTGLYPTPPPPPLANENVSAMRFAAYQRIWNEFYRDENLCAEVDDGLVDGDNTANTDLLQMRLRAWEHDYFTSNLPFAQKGDAVKLPIAISDPVIRRGADPAIGTPPGETYSELSVPNVSFPVSGNRALVENVLSGDPTIDIGEQLYADMGATSAVSTINDLRLAEALQKYLERAARAGTRLVEWIKGMFGVTLPDYTAQRPQYIGGLKTPVQISEVLNTTGGTAAGVPQGNMSGRGIGVSSGGNGRYTAREHCVIMTVMSIMPETAYQQGLEREWTKINDPKEFLNPMFARLGEQETFNREIAAFLPDGDGTWGYLPRYSEYRTLQNRVSGDFRTTLNYWHMGRIFDLSAGRPGLNQQFIECDATHRVFADTDPTDQKMYVHVLNGIRAVRPLPKYGTPSL